MNYESIARIELQAIAEQMPVECGEASDCECYPGDCAECGKNNGDRGYDATKEEELT